MVDSIGVATLGRIALVVAMSAGLIRTLAAEQHSREAFTRKADATCWVIGRLRSEATDHQEQSKRFGVMARSESRRADALETSLIQLLSRLSDAVEIDDPEALPADLVTTTTSRSPDKVSIKARIKAAIRTALQRLDGDDDAAAISHAIAAAGRLEPQPGLAEEIARVHRHRACLTTSLVAAPESLRN